MRLDDLRVIAALERTGSLSGAAREVGIGRATARRRLARLAEELGAELLTDGELTPVGREAARAGRDLGAQAHAMLERARSDAALASGRLLLIAPPGAPPEALSLLHRLVGEALNKHLLVWFTDDPVSLLRERGDIGMCVSPSPPAGPWAAPLVLRADRRLVTTAAWLEQHGPIDTVEDLLSHPLVWFGQVGQEEFDLPLDDGRVIPVRPTAASNDVNALRELVVAGGGVGFLPNAGALEGREVVPLVEVLPGVTSDRLGVYMILPDATRRNPAVREVLGMMKSAFGALGLFGPEGG